MAGLVLLVLPVSLLLVTVVATVAFLDAAFHEPQLAHVNGPATRQPSVGNMTLAAEIASTFQRLTEDPALSTRQASCSCSSFVPSVTEPEAIAIAWELRHHDASEMQRVIDRSQQSPQACPMLTETGLCACKITRPLACIGRCVVGGDSPEWATGVGDTVSEAFRRHLENRHVNSQTHRLNDALVSLLDKA